MSGVKISLKSFWEQVEARLAACSAEELRNVLRTMAWEVSPTERQAFLDKLERKEESISAGKVIEQAELLVHIDDLLVELRESVQDADAYEEQYEWDEEYDDEDSLGPYERFVAPLTELFDRAQAAFDYGQLSLARAAYGKLLDVLETEDDYGRGVSAADLTDVDVEEAAARYLRAVYETEPIEHRPQLLFVEMKQVQNSLAGPRPMLDHLIQVSPRVLPDQEQFLASWIALLRAQRAPSGSDADAWLREAIWLSQGTQGLEALARAEGGTYPRAYLDWFAALEQEGKHHEILVAAQEALRALAPGLPIRSAIADHLCAAAARLNEIGAYGAGRWEAFIVHPTLPRLLDLWELEAADSERVALMQRAARHMQEYRAHSQHSQAAIWRGTDDLELPIGFDLSVLTHAYLLGEDLAAAHRIAAGQKALGWSSSSSEQGLVVGFFLALMSGAAPGPLPPNVAMVWQSGLNNSIRFGLDDPSLRQRLERAYLERLGRTSLPHDRQEKYLKWCLDVAQQRVDAIVGNQYRGSYGKAAVLAVACAETLQSLGKAQAADTLLDEVRNRFPRHRAFQSDLKAAVQQMKRQ